MTTNTDTTAASGAASRTPTDYALEFAEYLARGAEHMIEAVCADAKVRLRIAESDDVDDDTEHDAQASVDEALRSLRDRIGEFRSRRDRAARAALAAPAAQEAEPAPIDMVLHCPACGLQHIDAPEPDLGPSVDGSGDMPLWSNPSHRSHLCHGCGHIWRPADVPTNGVAAVKTKGKADSPIASHPPRPQADTGAVAVPEGWRLVPAELTREMVICGAHSVNQNYHSNVEFIVRQAYKALLAAAPQAAAAPTAAEHDQLQRTAVGWQQRAEFAERNWLQCYRVALCNGADPGDFKHKPGDAWHATPAPAAWAAPTDAQIARVWRFWPKTAITNVARAIEFVRLCCAAAPAQEAEDAEVMSYAIDRETTVERVRQASGADRWAVRRDGRVLNKQGEWEWEPMPSSRDEAFLDRCRFESAREGIDAARALQEG